MNRNQFEDRLRNLAIEKSEMDRKWRMHIREQEEIVLMLEAQSRVKAAAALSPTSGMGGYVDDNSYIEDYVDPGYFE